MKKIVTGEQMKKLDQYTINSMKVPSWNLSYTDPTFSSVLQLLSSSYLSPFTVRMVPNAGLSYFSSTLESFLVVRLYDNLIKLSAR